MMMHDKTLDLPFDWELLQNLPDWQIIQKIPSLILIAAGGTLNYDFALAGQMASTPILQQLPALQKILNNLQRPLSRCRLIRLAQGEYNLHEASFQRYLRQVIYIPLIHCPEVQFIVENQPISLAVNTPYIIHGSQAHRFINPTTNEAVYLMCETLAIQAENNAPFLEPHQFHVPTPAQFIFLSHLIQDALTQSNLESAKCESLVQNLHVLTQQWAGVFARFEQTWQGELSYQDVILDFSALLNGKQPYLNATAQWAMAVLESVLATLNRPKEKRHFSRYFFVVHQPLPDDAHCPQFDRPIFIVSAPRSGSTLLFETLAKLPEIWTIGEESHELIEDIPSLHPAAQQFRSNRLTAENATVEIVEQLKKRFVRQLRNRDGINYLNPNAINPLKQLRFLEKTPKNAVRIPFLKAAFPDALFIYLYREPAENISSLIEGWRSLRFIGYRNIPQWTHRQWSFFLPEGWETLQEESIATIAAYQWQTFNATIVKDLKNLPQCDWYRISYTDLINNPHATIKACAEFAQLKLDASPEFLNQALPVSKLTLSTPVAEKWRKYEVELRPVLAQLSMATRNE